MSSRPTAVVALALSGLLFAGGCGGSRVDHVGSGAPAVTPAPGSTTTAPGSTTTAGASSGPRVDAVAPDGRPSAAASPVPPIPADAAALADHLVALAATVGDPATPDSRLAEAAQAQQFAYRAVAAAPGLLEAVSSRLPPSVRAAMDAAVSARLELKALSPRRTEPPRWRVVHPATASVLLSAYREAEAESGVPWRYLAAVHLIETGMGRIHSLSTAGARGPMQFMPATWARYGHGDIDDDRDAILAAGRFLRDNGAPAAMAAALRRYNPSDHYVRAVTAYAGQIVDERSYLAFYHWQVIVSLVGGDVVLPEGYGA